MRFSRREPSGNAFAILARAQAALKAAGASEAEVGEYLASATAGDYEALLRTTGAWVALEEGRN